ncbi:MAG: hypothetical protein NBV68_15565 [Erythrobacter sp.]|uniref:hypothetical protein n=1 Tax=Erythrobacter sp. TaxID=1042 RepID=UPI0025FFEC1B|nr:hypothetical protein [Erythrobacter sp.]MCM0000796.1 hypothetical protein [Erythrobacter sp.]
MMTEEKSPATPRPETPKWVRKILFPALAGGVVGYGAAAAALHLIGLEPVGGLGKSPTIATLVGVLYIVIGLAVGLGTLSPRVGARFLNVEDADELRELKKVLTSSGSAMVLWGVGLIGLALAAPDGPVPQAAALALGAGGLVIGTLLAIPSYRLSDELMRAVNLEAGAISYGLMLLFAGGWAMLAHLRYVAAPAPLDLLTLFYVVVLLASFIATGRRGMLTPR